MWHHVTLCDITWHYGCHVTSCDTCSPHEITWDNMWYHACCLSCRVWARVSLGELWMCPIRQWINSTTGFSTSPPVSPHTSYTITFHPLNTWLHVWDEGDVIEYSVSSPQMMRIVSDWSHSMIYQIVNTTTSMPVILTWVVCVPHNWQRSMVWSIQLIITCSPIVDIITAIVFYHRDITFKRSLWAPRVSSNALVYWITVSIRCVQITRHVYCLYVIPDRPQTGWWSGD